MRMHRRLGPGVLESIYDECLRYELTKANIQFQHQAPLATRYGTVPLNGLYIADMIVANQAAFGLKSVEHILPAS